jgi:hypothetical protein
MKAVHIDPVCRRVSGAQNRGNSVYTELSAEYVQCFRKMSFCDNRKWRKCILACAEPVLWIAISACIPMLSSSIEASLAEAHIVTLAVAHVFLSHLQQTWYGLENHALVLLRTLVATYLKKY